MDVPANLRSALPVASIVLGASLTFCAAASRGPATVLAPPFAPAPVAARDAASAVVEPDAELVDPFASESAPDPKWAPLDAAVEAGIAEGKLPGSVVVVGTRDEIVYRRAYGQRALEPARAPMTLGTVFDLASLTKPVATASSVMVLVDRGMVTLDEPVARYVPEFGRAGKGSISVRHLLLHVGGLAADNPMSDFANGADDAWRRIFDAPARRGPGERLVYSDVGFMVLGELVRRVSGQDLAAFAAANVFAPLGMHDTTFTPPAALKERAAPTELRDGGWMQGEVHDPRAYALGGVAGHAGLFSTARDLSRFAQAWLGKGALRGARVVSPTTFDAFLAPHDVPGAVRALGWDMMSPATRHRGEGLGWHAFGHGGFTGTALWIDPEAGFFVVFLSNRVHPNGKGAVHEIAARAGTLAAQLLARPAPMAPEAPCERATSEVLPGIDVLRADGFAALRGRAVALLTNASGRARDGARTIDLLTRAPDVRLIRIFTPEHGLGADVEGLVDDATDGATGLPVVSLYGASFSPPPEALEGIDTLVIDVQDVGARFYTYASTVRRALKAAAEAHLRVIVLDRPNPIGGVEVTGPVVDASSRSFVHHGALPVRHGMTLGELALMFDAEDHVGADVRVVRAQGWRRSDSFEATSLTWTSPSPNLRTPTAALLYPGVALVEGTNLSVGRGTDAPFELVGAPFVDARALAAALTKRALPGVSFTPATFVPQSAVFRGETCGGVRIAITDRARFEPVRTGVALAMDLRALYPRKWHFEDVNKLVANRAAMDAMAQGKSLVEVEASWEKDLIAFRTKREKYLLYRSVCPR
jgi:uncharacterized protein YbbC (DUF1343 family)